MNHSHFLQRLDHSRADLFFWLLTFNAAIISISIAASSLILGLIILSIVIFSIYSRRFIFERTQLDHLFVAYLVTHLLTSALSPYPLEAFLNMKRMLLIGLFYASTEAVRNRPERILHFLVGVGGSVAVLSLFEIVLFFLNGSERLYVFQHYMTTGGIKMIVLLLMIPFVLTPSITVKVRRFLIAAIVPILFALILTNTRSAWLGFLGGVVIIGIFYSRKMIYLMLIGIGLFFILAPASLKDRAASIIDPKHPSNAGRLMMWSNGVKIFMDHPLTGVGDIDLAKVYEHYKDQSDHEPSGHMHNNIIMIMVIHGLLGTIVLGTLFIQIFRLLFTQWKISTDPVRKMVSLSALSVVCGFLINGMFEWNFGDHEIMVFFWTILGLAIPVVLPVKQERSV